MEPDNYQQAWRAHSSQTLVTVDAELLRKAVRRDQQELQATISWSDFAVVGIMLLLLPVWIYMGVAAASPWTWYLMVPAIIWVAVFILVGRTRCKQTSNDPGEPLLSSVQKSLALVEQQIWFERKRVWWYLLPIAIPMLAYTAHLSWLKSRDWMDALCDVNALMFVFLLAFFYFLYYMFQYVVRTQWEPRRQELLTLLTSLRDETASEVSGEYPILMSVKRATCPRRRMVVLSLCFMTTLLLLTAGVLIVFRHTLASSHDHPEKSPFTAVRWQQTQPEVKVGDEWFKLVSLDDLPTAEIVAFSQRIYENKWQKRFEEDLVELLTRMDHPPQDTVKLVVQSLTSSERRTLEGVPMTEANRQAIKAAAQTRETSEP